MLYKLALGLYIFLFWIYLGLLSTFLEERILTRLVKYRYNVPSEKVIFNLILGPFSLKLLLLKVLFILTVKILFKTVDTFKFNLF